MGDAIQNLPRGKCAVCGKDIPIKSSRDKGPFFCSRIHASNAKEIQMRYRRTMAGPGDRPDINQRTKKL